MFVTATSELVVSGILNIIADDLRITIALTGQLITVYSIALAIGTPFLVSVTSRIGRKKVLICSLVVFIVGCLISFWSAQYSVLLFARVVSGIAAGVFNVVAFSSAAKLVPPEKLGGAIGTIILGFSTAMLLGVPIGITITKWLHWQSIFLILGIISFLILLGIMIFLPDIEGDAPISFKQQFTVLRNPIVISGLLVSFFWGAGNSVAQTYLTPYLQTILHMTTSYIGAFMLIIGIFGIIGSRLGGYGVDKWGTVRVISIGLAVQAVSLAFVPVFASIIAVELILITICMCSMFVTAPAVQTYIIQQAPQSANLLLGLNTPISHLGLAVGAGLGGLIVTATSSVVYNPWVASSVIALGLMTASISFSLSKSKGSIKA
ncbi:MFS transporter [Cohnella abietis]|uniref:Purine efflux pump PbuE n=1 Tax=Cohnella abietis TaxID=2507935 RepID=A0A3T1D823_9BACL|nr:MFS transporter [Cohnella abietis]BBI34237.1 purine efflux pump PbuE [Cohnella abietis]